MKRLDRTSVCLALCAGVAWSLAGCAGPTKPADPYADLPPLPSGEGFGDRAGEARKFALEFELSAGELQNAPLTRQRPQLKAVFGQLAEVLPRLAGPVRPGVFSHQYGVVVQVRDQLSNRPERLSDDALIDNGLIAAHNSLRDLSFTQFYADEDLTKRMDALAASVTRLPQTKGVDHAIQVSDAVTTMSIVLTKMAGMLYDRNAEFNGSGSATKPAATQPAPAEPAVPAPTPAPVEPAPSAPPAAPAGAPPANNS